MSVSDILVDAFERSIPATSTECQQLEDELNYPITPPMRDSTSSECITTTFCAASKRLMPTQMDRFQVHQAVFDPMGSVGIASMAFYTSDPWEGTDHGQVRRREKKSMFCGLKGTCEEIPEFKL